MYEVPFEVGWFDCDANRHLRTRPSRICDRSAVPLLQRQRCPASAIAKRQIGRMVAKDEIIYKRGLHFLEQFKMQFWL
jgi:acyl-CoA thioesterase FadM